MSLVERHAMELRATIAFLGGLMESALYARTRGASQPYASFGSPPARLWSPPVWLWSPPARFGLLLHILVAASLAICPGCESRDRTNPFDPGNPDTGGEPELLIAVAGSSQVALTWDLELFKDIRSIRLLRSSGSEQELAVLERQGSGAGSHSDALVENGITYTYRLEITGSGTDVLYTAPAVATPGHSRPWVGDASGMGAARLSPDGRHVVQRIAAFRELIDMQFEIDGSFWAADYRNGAVLLYDRDGEELREWSYYGVNTLAVDRKPAHIWAGSFLSQTLTLFDSSGGTVWVDSSLGLVEHVEASPVGGGAWVASRSTGVSRVERESVISTLPGFSWPVVVIPKADGEVWVVDRGGPSVCLITPVGPDSMVTRIAQAHLVSPRDGTADSSGGLWVADPDRGGVVYIGPDLEERFFIPLGRISSVTWDGPGERLWMASADEGRVLVMEREVDDVGDAAEWTSHSIYGPGANQSSGYTSNEGWIVTAEVAVGGRPATVAAWW